MATASRPRSPRIDIPGMSLGDITAILAQFSILLLFSVSFASLLEAALILSLHTVIFLPFEVARTLYRNRNYISQRQHITLFQAVVFSVVRVAFAYFDHEIPRVFFSTANAEPFAKRRLGPKLWKSCRSFYEPRQAVGGWWVADPQDAETLVAGTGPKSNRLVIMYVHGGGFALGSPTFYLEFLARLRSRLAAAHPSLGNVAIFAPYYPLAPEQKYPDQSIAIEKCWKYLSSHAGIEPNRLVAAGDSAGAALCVGLMNEIGKGNLEKLPMPQQSILISPWPNVELDPRHASILGNSSYDYVDPFALCDFASLLLYGKHPKRYPAIIRFWLDSVARTIPPLKRVVRHKLMERRSSSAGQHELQFRLPAVSAMPLQGTLVLYGQQEILREQTLALTSTTHDDTVLTCAGKQNAVHAWPVYAMFLGRDERERSEGIDNIVSFICKSC